MNPHKMSIAPMVDRTDRHFRYFARLFTPNALLYTEMLTTQAVINGDRDKLLAFSKEEEPIALQLAGNDPEELFKAVNAAEPYNYSEYNLNAGCPSDKIQDARYGACLMAEPSLVAELLAAMKEAASRPVTVKHRIGIDTLVSYTDLKHFVETIRKVQPFRYTVHARIAILQGLSPKENRNIPPLRYEDVYRLKQELPALQIEINGGFTDPDQAAEQLKYVDAVMIGRAAYDDPVMLRQTDRLIYGGRRPGNSRVPKTRREILAEMEAYIKERQDHGDIPWRSLIHMNGLCKGVPGSGKWRRLLGSRGFETDRGGVDFSKVNGVIPESVLDEKL